MNFCNKNIQLCFRKVLQIRFQERIDSFPSGFHIIYRKIMVPVEDGPYFLELEQIYVCFIYKSRFVVVQFVEYC